MYIIDEIKEHPKFEWLKKSNPVCIDIQNVADYYFHSSQEEWDADTDFPSYIPPFPRIWFEYRLPKTLNSEGKIIEIPYMDKVKGKTACFLESKYDKETKTGQAKIGQFHKFDDKITVSQHRIDYEFNSQGQLVKFPKQNGILDPTQFDSFKAVFYDQKEIDHYKKNPDLFGHLWVPIHPYILAISFMNCKNIQTEVLRHAFQSPKRQRQGKPPLTKIYTLKIDQIKRLFKTSTGSETLSKNALHICRGHFKDFRHGSGLFGRVKGLFWWEMQLRGSKESGEIKKDYQLIT